MINLNGIYKIFFPGTSNQVLALNNININLKAGDFVTIVGSNGAGKSTLLKVISGVEQADAGTIMIGGEDVTNSLEYERAKLIGRIDQNPMTSTAPEMSIAENMAMAYMRRHRRSLRRAVNLQRSQLFKEALYELGMGLENRLNVPVKTLSGGQRQALALIMSTIAEPKVLLLDEHTAALDPKAARQVMEITRKIVETKKITTVMVTHNMEQAIEYGNRLIMMHRGQIILDINQQEKSCLTVARLIDKFNTVSQTTFHNDRILLAN